MKDISKVLVCGGGMMGKNIALVLTADPAVSVTVYDVKDGGVLAGIADSARQLAESGLLDPTSMEERLRRISFIDTLDHPAAAEADIVFEAVFEDMAVKQQLFLDLEQRCRPDAIFCTNSSVMSPTEISSVLTRRERFVGTHFWNPAHLIPLVEVVRSDATAPETADAVMALLERVGKEPVLCKKDVPGFIANRMQHALWREAISIVERGIADAETVDKAVRCSFGMRLPRLGPMENADMVGLDLTYNIHSYILKDLEDSHEPSPLLKELMEEGKLGFKTGEGFRRWTAGEAAQERTALTDYLERSLHA